IRSVHKQSDTRADPFLLRVDGQHRLNMRAHNDLPNTTTRVAARDDVFKKPNATSPDVTRSAAQLFKTSTHDGRWRKLVNDPAIVLVSPLRLNACFGFGSRKDELSRHEMLACVKQRRRRSRIHE